MDAQNQILAILKEWEKGGLYTMKSLKKRIDETIEEIKAEALQEAIKNEDVVNYEDSLQHAIDQGTHIHIDDAQQYLQESR